MPCARPEGGSTPSHTKLLASLLAPCSFSYGIRELVLREELELGVQWDSLYESLEGAHEGQSLS